MRLFSSICHSQLHQSKICVAWSTLRSRWPPAIKSISIRVKGIKWWLAEAISLGKWKDGQTGSKCCWHGTKKCAGEHYVFIAKRGNSLERKMKMSFDSFKSVWLMTTTYSCYWRTSRLLPANSNPAKKMVEFGVLSDFRAFPTSRESRWKRRSWSPLSNWKDLQPLSMLESWPMKSRPQRRRARATLDRTSSSAE